jgi:uncharacterized protein (DUF2252 family)
MSLPSIQDATRDYESWLGGRMPLVADDLRFKHRLMRAAAFPFMRGTFYRWCQRWQALRSSDHDDGGDGEPAAAVLAVGDLHVENFGTWRDSDGRLIWGINDLDEAARLPWTQDVVRLTCSAFLAIDADHLVIRRGDAADAIFEGYRDGIASGGRPFVLEEDNAWLRRLATSEMRAPAAFWRKTEALPTARHPDPKVVAVLTAALPHPTQRLRIARRVAGVGSLGRPRFVAIARCRGGAVAREAKATAPSAVLWARGRTVGRGTVVAIERVNAEAVRAPDPMMKVVGPWLVRRLAPHCTRISLEDLPVQRDEERLLYAMGFETANIHLGTPETGPRIARQLRRRRGRWLRATAKAFAAAVAQDFAAFRAHA